MTKITLTKPITTGNTEITEITLREPKAGELRGIKLLDLLQLEYAAHEQMLQRITTPALSMAQISNLKAIDYTKLSAAVVAFFGDTEDFPTA